jgi:hypothetical protein
MEVKFLNNLVVDNNQGAGKAYKLYRALEVSVDGKLIVIPKGFETDFASVPWFFTRLFPKFHKTTNRPSVLHDYLYVSRITTRKQADDLFLKAMLSDGVKKWRAYSMYWAVRLGGSSAWKSNNVG